MENFFDTMKQTALEDIDCNVSVTENGALGYSTTGQKLVDLHFAISSLRTKSDSEIESMFMDAYLEDPKLAIMWLFYIRDVHNGLGERRLFRVCLGKVLKENPHIAAEAIINLCSLIPEYGRYDDLYAVFAEYPTIVGNLFAEQLNKDLRNMSEGKPVSLLAKWLKSENTSSKQSIALAKQTAFFIGWSLKRYRKTLAELRKYIDVVERKLSSKHYSDINYETVPSQASLKYKKAFFRNDGKRYENYLDSVSKGEKKINAATLYPCDIVHRYMNDGWALEVKDVDKTLEELWKALPNTVADKGSVMVVADGSGSMTSKCNLNSSITALDVANSLAIYFAERAEGPYKNKYITFSNNPQFVDFTNCRTLKDKIKLALKHDEIASTDIEKVFDLILRTAVNNKLSQSEIPETILIISDMEFNYASRERNEKRLFTVIADKYNREGYKLPRLVFWNVASRTNTIPLRENENGLVLVSGYSVNTIKMVMNGKLDPRTALLKEILDERYLPVYDKFISKIV